MPFADPTEKANHDRIRKRHLEDCYLLGQLIADWRESPRDSEAHKRGMSRLIAAWTELKGVWAADNIPIPKTSDKARRLASRATIYGGGGRVNDQGCDTRRNHPNT